MGSAASLGLLPHPQVQTKFGIVEGKRFALEKSGQLFNVFLGIPFSKPPIGKLRFRVCEPAFLCVVLQVHNCKQTYFLATRATGCVERARFTHKKLQIARRDGALAT